MTADSTPTEERPTEDTPTEASPPKPPDPSPPRRFRVPHTLVLIFAMVVLAYGATLVLPAGEFERVPSPEHPDREVVVADSFTYVEEAETLPAWTVFTAIPQGFSAAGDIIFFVFIVGGAFGVFRATGAVDAAIGVLLEVLGDFPALLIIAGLFVFAVGSATLGMAEEYLPFVPVLVILCIGLGYDAITAVAILCVGYGVGYGAALINPFTVLIAKEVAAVPPGSGLLFRGGLLIVFLGVGIQHVMSYASRVRRDPSKSLLAGLEPEVEIEMPDTHPKLTGRHGLVLVATVAAVGVLIFGISQQGWYLVEMGAMFLGLAVVLGLVGGLGFDTTAKQFCHGAAELTTTALLIGFARSIEVVLADGRVIDTIVHGISQPLGSLGASGAAVGMMVVQSATNLFIPSGSGQAFVTMPIMAPLADIVGVSREVAVLAYQFGDGFTNIVVPTNAVLVGILAMAGVPYDRWFRFILPFMIKVWIVGALALVVAVLFGPSLGL